MRILIAILLIFGSYVQADPGRNCRITSQTDVTVTTVSTKRVNLNGNRRCLIIVNKGTDSIFVKPDSAHSGTEGVLIPAGGNWEPFVVPINALWIKANSGSQTVTIGVGE